MRGLKPRLLALGLPGDSMSLRLWRLKNAHCGETGLIVGNGPSTTIEALEKTGCMVSVGMNQVFKIFDKTHWRPSYYAISDSVVAENFGERILAAYQGVILASDHLRPVLGADSRIIYFPKDHEVYEEEYPGFSTNCLNVVHGGYTTAYLCMQLFWHFGIRDMLTMGVDAAYDFSGSEKIGELGKYEVVSPGPNENWFIPGYFDSGEKMLKPKVKQQVIAYLAAQQFFSTHGGSIKNVGINSPLNVFEKCYLDHLV
jgi:hypothetical protein